MDYKAISLIILAFLISISMVSAEDLDNSTIAVDDDAIIGNNEIPTDNPKTFTDLQTAINNNPFVIMKRLGKHAFDCLP